MEDQALLPGMDALPGDILEHMPEAEIQRIWPQTLVEYVDVLKASLIAQGETPERAAQLAYNGVRAIGFHEGGQYRYIPKGEQLDTALRDKQLWDEFDGKNILPLATKYKVGQMQVYKIIQRQRKLHQERTYYPMPGVEP